MIQSEDLRTLDKKYANDEPVLFALIERGEIPDWKTGNFPDYCLWIPESIFDEIQALAKQRNCKILGSIDKYARITVNQNKLVDIMLEFGTVECFTENPDVKVVISKLQKLTFEVRENLAFLLLIEGPHYRQS